jgi:hypothetical protein
MASMHGGCSVLRGCATLARRSARNQRGTALPRARFMLLNWLRIGENDEMGYGELRPRRIGRRLSTNGRGMRRARL